MSYEKTLNLIISNDLIMEELKRLFDEEADKSLPTDSGQSSEIIGQQYRAHCKAKEIINDTFLHLKMMQQSETSSNGIKYK